MKKIVSILIVTLLPMVTLTTLTSCSDKDAVQAPIINNGSSNGSGLQNLDIVVTVDEFGHADGGHRFSRINDSNFYIDDIKYTAVNGNLEVTGYDQAYFTGVARIISVLNYNGRSMKVVSIEREAFYHCNVITSVIIPNSVTSIGSGAFCGCSNLTSATIGNGVTYFGDNIFDSCPNFKKLIVPDIATWCRIDNLNKDNCILYDIRYMYGLYSDENTEIKNLVIPNGVTSIGEWKFYGCNSLVSVTIPESVTNIANFVFCGCHNLNSIKVANNNTTYDSRNNCNAIIKTASNELFMGCKGTVIPNSVKSIGDYAFYECSGLTSVNIPNSVTNIGECAFSFCSSLTSVTIPSYVTSIGNFAFYECTSLTSITIPNSVTSIGISAFLDCSSLTSVTLNSNAIVSTNRSSSTSMKSIFGNQVKTYIIGSDVTSIGEYVFAGCTSLTSITIPNSVTSIGLRAFYRCSSLKDVYCYATNPPSTYYPFENTPISSATLHVPAGSIDAYKTTSFWSDFGTIVAIQ